MQRQEAIVSTVARGGLPQRSAYGRFGRYVGAGLLGLGLAGALGGADRCAAQTRELLSRSSSPEKFRLTVRPREMVLGTRTERAGLQVPDSLPVYAPSKSNNRHTIYVPEQCVGTRRCPLVILLWAGGVPMHQAYADKYGMILFVRGGGTAIVPVDTITANFDATVKYMLQHYAIDPDKIALVGRCSTAWDSYEFGRANLDIFSRIGVGSFEVGPYAVTGPQNKKAEFFFATAVDENFELMPTERQVRQAGHPTKYVLGLRGHENQEEEWALMGKWLHESWTIPDPAARPVPRSAPPAPLLTTEMLTQMTTFWTRFMQEPDSIKHTARRAHLVETLVPVGTERVSVLMTDIPALAARYPSVAAALKEAGLTATQADVYRAALVSAKATGNHKRLEGVEATSVLGKNVAFLKAHPEEVQALVKLQMWLLS